MEFGITICIPTNKRVAGAGRGNSVTVAVLRGWRLFCDYFRKCTVFFGPMQAFLHVFFILFCEYQRDAFSQMICEKLKNGTFAKIGHFALL